MSSSEEIDIAVKVNNEDIRLSDLQSERIKSVVLGYMDPAEEAALSRKEDIDIVIENADNVNDSRSAAGGGGGQKKTGTLKRLGVILGLDHFDYNHYATKKTIGQALLLLALAATNASMLKVVMQVKRSNQFYAFLATFTILGMLLLFVIAVLILVVGRSNINTENRSRLRRINLFNDCATGIILILTILVIIVCSFGMINNPLENNNGNGGEAKQRNIAVNVVLQQALNKTALLSTSSNR